MLNRRADKLELLRIAEAVALEKSIDKELIIDSMENGIAKAAKSKFGSENEIKVEINRDNGDIGIFRKLQIVDSPENSNLEISLDDAIKLNENNKDKKVGDEVLQPLPSFDFGRIAAQTAKQVISSNVREAERERQYNDFKDKIVFFPDNALNLIPNYDRIIPFFIGIIVFLVFSKNTSFGLITGISSFSFLILYRNYIVWFIQLTALL